MSFRTSRDAFTSARRSVVRVLACVTNAYVDAISPRSPETTFSLHRGEPIRLDATVPLSCSMTIRYVAVQSGQLWEARVSAYWYALFDDRREILMYHWHPAETPRVTFPHLHLEAGSGVRRDELTRAHLPTGHVSLAAFLRLAINDFGVSSRRDDWHDLLARGEQEMMTR